MALHQIMRDPAEDKHWILPGLSPAERYPCHAVSGSRLAVGVSDSLAETLDPCLCAQYGEVRGQQACRSSGPWSKDEWRCLLVTTVPTQLSAVTTPATEDMNNNQPEKKT